MATVNPFLMYSENQNAMRIESQLKTNQLFDKLDKNALKHCMEQIIQTFGGYKSMLYFITQYANQNQLNSIHEITKQRMLQQKKQQNHQKQSNSLFHQLPNECISYILGFFNKHNIKQFKLTSRQIATVCLREMNKITIQTINANKLLYNNNIVLYQFIIRKCPFIQKSRHHITNRYASFFDFCEKSYNIPEENQLIFLIYNTQNIVFNDWMNDTWFSTSNETKTVMINKRVIRSLHI